MPSHNSLIGQYNVDLVFQHNVDIVFCIDGSGSMKPYFNTIKHLVFEFVEGIAESFAETGRIVNQLRAKVIEFRDFRFDTNALVCSSFFVFPEAREQFIDYIDSIRFEGGGDREENGLEALSEAINSEWDQEGRRHRHIILLFTDSSAADFGNVATEHAQYPKVIPASLSELEEWWNDGAPNGRLKSTAQRLILFSPNEYPWDQIAMWQKTIHVPFDNFRKGCSEIEIEQIKSVSVKDF